MISLSKAHSLINKLQPLQSQMAPLENVLSLVCAENITAAINCPTVDSSLKDGYAVISNDILHASPASPVTLAVTDALTAGDENDHIRLTPGTATRIMTGASIPEGATAVLASEFAIERGSKVTVLNNAHSGRNILTKGNDVLQGQRVAQKGDTLVPTLLGLLSAAGIDKVQCYPRPRIGVAATGSELVWPGEPVGPGKVAASNMVTAVAELQTLGISALSILLRDTFEILSEQFSKLVNEVDILITCGGVLDGDKDLTIKALEDIGMVKIFHRVRIGPGKGASMGKVGNTLIFNLPGGPPSNHVSLILLALPGVRRLMGHKDYLPPKQTVKVTESLTGQKDWTQLFYAKTCCNDGSFSATPLTEINRFQAMATADCLIEIAENQGKIERGGQAKAWVFRKT